MNQPTPSPSTFDHDSVLLTQSATDRLVRTVNEQIAEGTFDATNESILRELIESFSDSRGLVRLRIAETLGGIGKPATSCLLEGLTHHANPVVRRACAKTLTLIADPVAIPMLLDALFHDEDTVVKGSAVGALARIGEPAVPPLLDILASPHHPESTKGHAAWALAFIGTEAQDYLYPALNSDSEEVRTAVIGAIAKVAEAEPKESTFAILMQALTDPSQNVRSEAAAALGNLTHQPAVSALQALLQHSCGDSRKAAALALMKIGDITTLPSLQTALEQESEDTLQPILRLAISQLQKRAETSEWD